MAREPNNYAMFKKRAGVLYRDLKHNAIAECFRSDKARTASFFNGLKNKSLHTLIREESLKIYVSKAQEIGREK